VKKAERFSRQSKALLAALALPFFQFPHKFQTANRMKDNRCFDAIIVGGSYSGLSAGMALGRALRQVLIIDGGKPCNRQTPRSHNFLTQDGNTPNEISRLAKQQVEKYETVVFSNEIVINASKTESGFNVQIESGETFRARKLIFATGVKDIMPGIEGYAECWGISVLHCPYCHGYEVRDERTGILGNGEYAFEFCNLISNWTEDLTLFTNGPSTLTAEQTAKIERHNIRIVENEIGKLEHTNGYLENVVFKDGARLSVKALYTRNPFEQHCTIPAALGCELTDEGYIRTDFSQKTSVRGIFACGDNTARARTIANAVAMGTAAGMMANKEIVFEEF
jgi:thioredoxin reductase